jgi:hypothetical protein
MRPHAQPLAASPGWLFAIVVPPLNLYGLIAACHRPVQGPQAVQRGDRSLYAPAPPGAVLQVAYEAEQITTRVMPDIAVVAAADQGIGREHSGLPGVCQLVQLSTGKPIAYRGELAYVDQDGRRVLNPYSVLRIQNLATE